MAALFQSISVIYQAIGVSPTLSIPKPSGLVLGELMVVSGTLNRGGVSTVILPGGWTKTDQREPTIGNPKGFLGFKVADAADVAASNFILSHTLGTSDEWVAGITRYSGALNIDTFGAGVIDNLGSQTSITYPSHTTVVDNVLIHRYAGWDQTGTEPTAVGLSALHTRRAVEGGFVDPFSTSDVIGVWDTLDLIVTPPGFVAAANFTQTGAGGFTRGVIYTAAIAPLLFTLLTQADIETRKRVLMSKGRNLAVVVANPGSAVQSDTPGLYLVKDPQAGVGGFGKPPESADDARGDANDGWKLYSFDDVGTAYNL